MKLGVFTVLFGDRPLEAALDRIVAAGLDCVEIGTGNYPGNAHCRPEELLADDAALKPFQHAIASRGLEISALSCHGNPLHPRREVARASHETFVRTRRAGPAPGRRAASTCSAAAPATPTRPAFRTGSPAPGRPNTASCWSGSGREKVIPYWQRAGGVRRAARRPPGLRDASRASSSTTRARLLRLREACGEAIGANLDPSHLFWQGIDIESAIAELGQAGAIFHTHAKDTAIHPRNAALNGVLDTVPLGEVGRPVVGLPHRRLRPRRARVAADPQCVAAGRLRRRAVDRARGRAASIDEGFAKAVAFLRSVMPSEPALADAWWT